MSKIKIDWAKVDGIKADFVKGEVKVTLRMALDTGLEIRSELASYADLDQPVTVEIKPWQSRLPGLEKLAEMGATLTAGGGKESSDGDAQAD